MTRLEKLQQFLVLEPDDSFTKYAIGLEYASMKEYPTAITHFEELLAKDPAYVATYYQLADAYRISGNNEKAIETYKVGIIAAKKANDLHAASELQSAWDDLEEELEL
jgi:tetratricopeptide (TPR) repeat protein